MSGISGQAARSVGRVMFTRNSYSILRQAQCSLASKGFKYSTNAQEAGSAVYEPGENQLIANLIIEHRVASEKDPAPLFFNKQVQDLLKTLTRPDPKKLFRRQKDGNTLKDPEMKFMTTEQLEAARREAEMRGQRRLQMPPVIKKRTEIDSVLSKDPALQGYDTAKYVFTDITYGINDYERLMVVREPNGILRHAKWDERQRLHQIYYASKGKEIVAPRMFHGEYLQDLLNRGEYEFILDRACLQYDPNDPEYHRVTKAVYATVNNQKHFDKLRSTRHYGPLAFHLAWTKNIDNLLLENITTDRLEDAALLIKLYNKINPTAKSAAVEYNGNDLEYIQNYIDMESPIRGKLEVALQALKELIKARQDVAEGVKKAHGM